MRGRILTVALAVGLAGGEWAAADQAKTRGSSGGGGSQGATSRHPSPSGGSSSHGGSGGSSYGGSHNGGGAPRPGRPLTQAERRHPRAGTGHGYAPYHYYPGYGNWYYPGYYPGYYYGYSPYWYSGLYFGAAGGYWGGYGYGGYGGYGYSSDHSSDAGAVRLLVDPEDTKVYVDGYYAGEVDDFDGMFQHLSIAPGRHEITLKKDGYRTHRYRVYVGEGSSLKLRHEMERGSGADTMEDLAGEKGLYEERARREDDRPPDLPERGEDLDRPMDREPNTAPAPPPPDGVVLDGRGGPGLLRLVVTPDDASVYVDGRFFGSARQSGEIELTPGTHRVEVVRPGFRTVERDVTIEARGTRTLSVTLDRP